MASHPKTLALNLGMQNISMAEFEMLPDGGLILTGYETAELMPDPAADITRNDQIKNAVEGIRQSLKLKKGVTASQCLPSQAVFTRFVKLPGASAEDVRAVIGFEAQQNVPFPIDEVIWDYQMLGGERDSTWDVALVAIKSDQLSQVYEACEKGGVRAKHVDVAPMALCNAFRYNYSDCIGTTLLIDMGARTTNLLFIDGDRVFSRTIPIGGNTISANIAKELEQDITLAETFKKAKVFVALGGAYAEDPDRTVAKASKVTRTTMTRLHAEITRSISFYRANQGGTQPVRVLLCGGSMSMDYMLEFFKEKLQLSVELFNPLRNVSIANPEVATAVSSRIHTLGELVGLGLRSIKDCPLEINLLPTKASRELELARRKPALIAALLCLAMALLSVYFFYYVAAQKIEEVATGMDADISRLKAISKEIQQVRDERQHLQELAAPLLLAADESQMWLTLLDALGKNLPSRFIWVTKLTPLSGGEPFNFDASAAPAAPKPKKPAPPPPKSNKKDAGKDRAKEPVAPPTPMIDAIRIEGLYLENPAGPAVVDTFVDKLAKSNMFVIDDAVRTEMVRTQPDGSSWAYGYAFVLPLKSPIALPQ